MSFGLCSVVSFFHFSFFFSCPYFIVISTTRAVAHHQSHRWYTFVHLRTVMNISETVSKLRRCSKHLQNERNSGISIRNGERKEKCSLACAMVEFFQRFINIVLLTGFLIVFYMLWVIYASISTNCECSNSSTSTLRNYALRKICGSNFSMLHSVIFQTLAEFKWGKAKLKHLNGQDV